MHNFALVGCGGMGHWHAQQLKKLSNVNVVALCDIVPAQMKPYREKYFSDAAEYESLEALLDSPPAPLDAVVLVTPHATHYPLAKLALERGVNVMVEKPMVTCSEHAYDLWRTVNRTGKKLAITFQSPYTPEFGYLARARDAGQLGKVQLISGWLSQGWLKGTAGKWRQIPAISGGGQMYDSGAHLLNAIMWLMNEPVVEVSCLYDTCGSPVDINGVAIFRFQGGALASVCIGGNCPHFRTEISIQTDKLLIVTDMYGGKLEMKGPDNRTIYPTIEADDRPAAGSPHANFVNALEGKEPLRAPVRYGVLLSALMDALYESFEKRRPVQVKAVPGKLEG